MHILINASILFLLSMNLLSNIFRVNRMERQILWLSKQLAKFYEKIFQHSQADANESRVSSSGYTGPTGPETGLTGNAAIGSDSAKKDDSIVSAEDQDWRVPL